MTLKDTVVFAIKEYPKTFFDAFDITMWLHGRGYMEYFEDNRVARELRRQVTKGLLTRTAPGRFTKGSYYDRKTCPTCKRVL